MSLPPLTREPAQRIRMAKDLIARIQLLSHWTQSDLANTLMVSTQTISNWVVGHRAPTVLTINKLQMVLRRVEMRIKDRARVEKKSRVARSHPTATRAQYSDAPKTREVKYGER